MYREISSPNMALQYYEWWGEYFLYDTLDNLVDGRCNGSDLTICLDSTFDEPKWSVENHTLDEYIMKPGLLVDDCIAVDDQCNQQNDFCVDVYVRINPLVFIISTGIQLGDSQRISEISHQLATITSSQT